MVPLLMFLVGLATGGTGLVVILAYIENVVRLHHVKQKSMSPARMSLNQLWIEAIQDLEPVIRKIQVLRKALTVGCFGIIATIIFVATLV